MYFPPKAKENPRYGLFNPKIQIIEIKTKTNNPVKVE